MRFKQMVFWLTVLLIYIMATRISIDSDTWWHLRAGKWMIENRQIITSDYFSYTRYGSQWLYPGWLIQIPMAWIEGEVGMGGLNLLTGLFIAITFAFEYLTLKGNELARAFLSVLAATVSGVYWSARPHLVTLLFTALFLYLLERGADQGFAQFRKWLWIVLPLVMLAWVNMHGGFIIGFLIWGIYLVELLIQRLLTAWSERRRLWEALHSEDISTLLIAGLVMGLVAMLNPLGYRIYLYPLRTVSIQKLQVYIQEWQSPDFHSLSMQPFIWLCILLFIVSAFSGRRWALRDVLFVSIFLYLALMAGRNVALFALVAPLPIARALEHIELQDLSIRFRSLSAFARQSNSAKEQPMLNLILVGLILLVCVYRSVMAFPHNSIFKELSRFYPIGAVDYLRKERPPGNLYNSYNWGAYLLWTLPEYAVFVDGRTDLYNDEILDQWFQIAQAQDGWEQVVERWNIQIILMEKEWRMSKLFQQSGWCQTYHDEVAIVLEKCP